MVSRGVQYEWGEGINRINPLFSTHYTIHCPLPGIKSFVAHLAAQDILPTGLGRCPVAHCSGPEEVLGCPKKSPEMIQKFGGDDHSHYDFTWLIGYKPRTMGI